MKVTKPKSPLCMRGRTQPLPEDGKEAVAESEQPWGCFSSTL